MTSSHVDQHPEGCSRPAAGPGRRTSRLLLILAAALCLALPAAGQEAQEAKPTPPVDQEAKPTPPVDQEAKPTPPVDQEAKPTLPGDQEAEPPLEPEPEPTAAQEEDPAAAPAAAASLSRLDRFNMRAAGFNYWVNQHAVKPLAKVYNLIIPKFGQRGIENFLINLDRPRDFLNSLLQAKPERAGRHLGSLLLNTTLGVGGLFYVSDHFLADAPPETFSETLGVWGVPTGPYIVLPFIIITDTSPRGIIGTAVDGTMHPLFWIGYTTNNIGGGTLLAVGASVRTAGGLNTVATLMPSPWFGSKSEWEAFEELFAERTPYLEKKRLYYDNQRLDVED